MIDFDTVPDEVKHLATGLLLQNIGGLELVAMSPPNALAVAANCGLDEDRYIEAINWLGTYHTPHAEALRR